MKQVTAQDAIDAVLHWLGTQVKLLLNRELTAELVHLKAECQTGIVRHPHGC